MCGNVCEEFTVTSIRFAWWGRVGRGVCVERVWISVFAFWTRVSFRPPTVPPVPRFGLPRAHSKPSDEIARTTGRLLICLFWSVLCFRFIFTVRLRTQQQREGTHKIESSFAFVSAERRTTEVRPWSALGNTYTFAIGIRCASGRM